MIGLLKFVAFGCFIFCMQYTVLAQDDLEVPEAVRQAFKAKYPDEHSPKWNEDSHGYYEAKFKKKGEKYRADFDKSGYWIETENDVKYSELPAAVIATLQKRNTSFDQSDITEIEYVTHYTKGQFYDIEFRQKGKNFDLMVRPDGTIIY